MNKLPIITLSALIPVLLSIVPQAFADPKHCYSYNDCYNIGYGHGYTDGQNGYSSVEACDNHSEAYCGGYNQGYRDAASNDGNSGLQQGQYSQLNIHGNNNDVRVNQGENVQSGSGDGGGSSSGHHSGSFLSSYDVTHTFEKFSLLAFFHAIKADPTGQERVARSLAPLAAVDFSDIRDKLKGISMADESQLEAIADEGAKILIQDRPYDFLDTLGALRDS